MTRSSDPTIIAFRTAYYGERNYEKSATIDQTGLRTIDLLGPESIYNLNLLFAEMLDSQIDPLGRGNQIDSMLSCE